MTRFVPWWVHLSLITAIFVAPAYAQKRTVDEKDQPNTETLRRLAQQLQGSNTPLSPNIDPELMKLAANFLEKNPDLMKDPAFQKQVRDYQQQAQQNPEQFAKLLKQKNPGLDQQQIESLKKQFQLPNPNGSQPPSITPPVVPPKPSATPSISPRPSFGGELPPRPIQSGQPPALPWQPSAMPGQQNQWNPDTQFPNPSTGPWQPPEEKAQAKVDYQRYVGLWEKNFGSIDNTPALKKSLIEIYSGEGKSPWDGKGANRWDNNGGPNESNPNKPWWDNGNGANGGSQSALVNWLKNATSGGAPSWLKNMSNWNVNTPPPPNLGSGWNPPQPSMGSGFSGGGGGIDLSSGAWPAIILVSVLVLAVGGFMLWRYWPKILAMRDGPKPVAGLGPWTIDPRDVTDRETLVKAFDYLSVLICGDGARVWNHMTIADTIRENVPGAEPFAIPLARLYALARYSPANEMISPADITEARGYLCRLAEVQA